MHVSIHLKDARLQGMGLAKVGNPLRQEPLQTSKELCRFAEEEADLLTHCFLKSFRGGERYRFDPGEDHEEGEESVAGHAAAIFADNDRLLERSDRIARLLYAKSRHPNIKSGDLCVGLLEGVIAAGEVTQALCIIKSESKVPFLQVAVVDGDLRLVTQQGIYPDKIDKGCLVIDREAEEGYWVYVFDQSGAGAHFWLRDFLEVTPADENDFQTRRYSEMCLAFTEKGLPPEMSAEERVEIANRAFDYLDENEDFDLQDFKQSALEQPELIEQFTDFKSQYEDAKGQSLNDKFVVVKETAEKVKKRLKARLKLDTGVDIRFSSGFIKASDQFLEKGFDEDRHMKFVKIWFHQET